MISNITSGNSFYDVAMYNQKKVNQGEASILYSQKLRGTKPETLQRAFQNYNLSISTKPVIHVSLSFAREDEGQLTDEKMVVHIPLALTPIFRKGLTPLWKTYNVKEQNCSNRAKKDSINYNTKDRFEGNIKNTYLNLVIPHF